MTGFSLAQGPLGSPSRTCIYAQSIRGECADSTQQRSSCTRQHKGACQCTRLLQQTLKVNTIPNPGPLGRGQHLVDDCLRIMLWADVYMLVSVVETT